MRRLAPLLIGAILLAGCGGGRDAAAPPAAPKPPPRPREPARRLARVEVTVVDGDTNERVPDASVQIGTHFADSDRRGVARVPLGRRGAYITQVGKNRYLPRAVRLSFRTHPKSTVRVYRRALQWPRFGSRPALAVRPPFRVVWSRGLGGLVEFPAVVSDGIAYVGNYRETIRALDMRNGDVVWRRDVPGGKMASSPGVWGSTLLVHGMDGVVRVLRRSDGRPLWTYRAGSPIESSPTVAPGGPLDVFGTWSGRLVGLDLFRRRVRWSRSFGCKITSTVAVAGSTLFVGDYCGRLLAVRARDGALLWSRSVNGRVYGTPAVSGGRVFVPSSTGGSLTAFSTNGSYLWRRDTGSYVYSSPAVDRGRVFFGSYNGVFYALSARTGATLWTRSTGGPISGAATVVDGVAYAGSFAHRILGVDARSGRVVLDFPHGQYVPVSGAGRRLLLHGYSRIFAVERR